MKLKYFALVALLVGCMALGIFLPSKQEPLAVQIGTAVFLQVQKVL